MPKRGEHIHKRKDGRWEARYKKGIDDNGKTIYGSLYANTYREVKEKLQFKLQDIASGFVSVKKHYTFSDAACLWLKDSQLSLKGASVYRYENLLNTHILPDFGNRCIGQITGTDINSFLATKLISGRVDGKGGLSPTYVRSIMLVMKTANSTVK